jgi:hypothetical protein
LTDRLDHDWQESSDKFETRHRTFDLITTSINNALRRSLLKEVQARHYIDERSGDHQQLLGLQSRLAAQKKVPSSTYPND